MSAVYFDHNASSPLDVRVLEAMMPYLASGNASSRHSFGRRAREAVDTARQQVAQSLGAHPTQLVFTSGGTEADNIGLLGIGANLKPSQIVVSAVEHPAVMRSAEAMRRQGWALRKVGVDADGLVRLDDFSAALEAPTGLVSVMMANNETGVVQDIATFAELAKQRKAVFHTDAVQGLGKMPINFAELNRHGVGALSVSAHKIGGPQGAGALLIDKKLDIRAIQFGGGQEKGLRGGSENVAAIVGFGAACSLFNVAQNAQYTHQLREVLEQGVVDLGGVIFGGGVKRLSNTSFFAFSDMDGETLVVALDRAGYAVASGSACSSDSTEPSPVLLAMGVMPELAQGAVRVSLSHSNTMQEVQDFLKALSQALNRMQQLTAIAA
ncbi:MAG: cysteine desulfurase family protein [Methylophilaceae bacterium]